MVVVRAVDGSGVHIDFFRLEIFCKLLYDSKHIFLFLIFFEFM